MDKFQGNFYEEDEPFDYDLIRPLIEQHTLPELRTFATKCAGSKLGKLTLLRSPDEPDEAFFAIPGHKVVWFDSWTAQWDTIFKAENVIYPANEDYEKIDAWLEVVWHHDEDTLSRFSEGGKTDFYERYGVWPHYTPDHSGVAELDGTPQPLTYTASATVDGRRLYLFYDLAPALYEKYGQLNGASFFDSEDNGAVWATWEDNLQENDDIKLLPLSGDSPLMTKKRYVPLGPTIYTPFWPQEAYPPDGEVASYLLEIAPFTESDGDEDIMETPVYGDYGSWFLFSRPDNTIAVIYQQG